LRPFEVPLRVRARDRDRPCAREPGAGDGRWVPACHSAGEVGEHAGDVGGW